MRRRMSDAVWDAIIFILSILATGFLTWWIWILIKAIVCLGVGCFMAILIASIF